MARHKAPWTPCEHAWCDARGERALTAVITGLRTSLSARATSSGARTSGAATSAHASHTPAHQGPSSRTWCLGPAVAAQREVRHPQHAPLERRVQIEHTCARGRACDDAATALVGARTHRRRRRPRRRDRRPTRRPPTLTAAARTLTHSSQRHAAVTADSYTNITVCNICAKLVATALKSSRNAKQTRGHLFVHLDDTSRGAVERARARSQVQHLSANRLKTVRTRQLRRHSITRARAAACAT